MGREDKKREASLCVSLFRPLFSFIFVSVLIMVANRAQLPDFQLSSDVLFWMPESVRELLVSPRAHCFVLLLCIVFLPIHS